MTHALTLYEIGQEYAALEAALLESGGEYTELVEAQFNALGELERSKVDAYYHVTATMRAYADACRNESERLREKANVADNAEKAVKAWMQRQMEARGLKELKGDTWKASIQANGGVQKVELRTESVNSLPREWTKIIVEPDFAALRANAGPDGRVIDAAGNVVAEVLPRQSHLRFR